MSSIRKISWLVGITGLVLAMASGTASGNGFVPDTLVIYENDNEIGPEFTLFCPQNPCQFAFDTGSPQGTTESVIINGTLTTVSPTTQITMGTYTVLLTEGPPGLTTPISDIVTLTAGPTSTNLGFEQHITITFTSDSEIGLPSNLTCATTICLAETGTVQDMFGFQGSYDPTGASALNLKVRSDPPEAVPEPTSLLLLGSGLVGLAAWRRKAT